MKAITIVWWLEDILSLGLILAETVVETKLDGFHCWNDSKVQYWGRFGCQSRGSSQCCGQGSHQENLYNKLEL